MKYSTLVALALAAGASARPLRRQNPTLAAGQAAVALNNQFSSLTSSSPCTEGQDACVNGQFAQCVSGAFVTTACAAGTICAALPTTQASPLVTCTTQEDLEQRLAATGATSTTSSDAASSAAAVSTDGATASSTAAADSATASSTADNSATGTASTSSANLQNSTQLDPSQVATGFLQNGQAVQEAGQVPSLTSSNNFINFCATTNQQISNGIQIATGSCNPAIMGQIPSTQNMPSAKFTFPTNQAVVTANTPFTVTMNIQGLTTGNFVNADLNYFAAPQQLDSNGVILGHSHVVIEAINGLNDTTPTDPENFVFFKGLNSAAVNGQLTANVSSGLAAGTYRLSSINTAANHQPVLVPVAQHGALDDQVYFTVQ